MKPSYWLIALVAVGAVVWWGMGHPGFETSEQRAERVELEQQAVEAAKPRLYRWHDRNGTLQVTSAPPKGRKYELVDVDKLANDNVIPMSDGSNPPPASPPAAK